MPSISQRTFRDSNPLPLTSNASGLAVRLKWGEQHLAEHFLHPKKDARFTVGSEKGVDFATDTRLLGQPSFPVVSMGDAGFAVHFTHKMSGKCHRPNEVVSLDELLTRREALTDDAHHTFFLRQGDLVSIDLGSVQLEAELKPIPKPVASARFANWDYTALNVFLAVFLLMCTFIIAALLNESEKTPPDDHFEKGRWAKTYVLPKPAPKLKKTQTRREKGFEHAVASAQKQSKLPSKPTSNPQTQNLLSQLFGNKKGSTFSVLDSKSGAGYKEALGNIIGPSQGMAGEANGMRLKGGSPGGAGSLQTIGIEGIQTSARDSANRVSQLKPKASMGPNIPVDEPTTCTRCDKELIAQVIHRNRGQIRYCYENQLTRHPHLAGKVAIQFVISPNGSVTQTTVSQSTVNNSELEKCVASRLKTFVFPKGKEGEAPIIVTYPFLFKQAGE